MSLAKTRLPEGFSASQYVYAEEKGIFQASGSVEVVLGESRIYADNLYLDQKNGIGSAEGNVRFEGKDFSARCRYIYFNVKTKELSLSDLHAEVYPEEFKGKILFSAERMFVSSEVMSSGPGKMTACDHDVPHYYLLTDKADYQRGDSYKGTGATLKIGGLPVFWMPLLSYSFSREERRSNLTYGYNQVEGSYLKSAWEFPAGDLLLDYMEKKGWGYGVNLTRGSEASNMTGLFLYHVDEIDTGYSDWIEKFSHAGKINPWTAFKLSQSYTNIYQIPSGRFDRTGWEWELSDIEKYNYSLKFSSLADRAASSARYFLQFDRSFEREDTSYFLNYEYDLAGAGGMRNSQRFAYSRPFLSDNVIFSTTTDYYQGSNRSGEPGQEKIEPRVEIFGHDQENNWRWRLTESWFLDLRQQLYPGIATYEYLEKQPEIEIDFSPMDLNLFSVQSGLGFGSYRESKQVSGAAGKRVFGAQRLSSTLNVARVVHLGLESDMLLGAGYDQFFYGTGDQLFAYRENVVVQTDIGPFFRNELNYRKGTTQGNSPFFFDRLGASYHDLTEKMVFYNLDRFAWSFEGGRNWQSARWFDLMSHLMLAPTDKLKLTADGGWDIENRLYKDLVTSIKLRPASYFGWEVSTVQDPNSGRLKSGNMSYDVYFMEGAPNQAYLRLEQGYDANSSQFKLRDVILVKDLHCWEMRFNYSDYRKEYNFSFRSKALPEKPGGFLRSLGF